MIKKNSQIYKPLQQVASGIIIKQDDFTFEFVGKSNEQKQKIKVLKRFSCQKQH